MHSSKAAVLAAAVKSMSYFSLHTYIGIEGWLSGWRAWLEIERFWILVILKAHCENDAPKKIPSSYCSNKPQE